VDELGARRADVGLAWLAVGLEVLAEGADGGVVDQGREHRHVQGLGAIGSPVLDSRVCPAHWPDWRSLGASLGVGHGLLGAVEAPVFAQQGQQPRGGGGGGAYAGDGFEQRGLLLQAGVVVEVAKAVPVESHARQRKNSRKSRHSSRFAPASQSQTSDE